LTRTSTLTLSLQAAGRPPSPAQLDAYGMIFCGFPACKRVFR
jgi:hypothetical protein